MVILLEVPIFVIFLESVNLVFFGFSLAFEEIATVFVSVEIHYFEDVLEFLYLSKKRNIDQMPNIPLVNQNSGKFWMSEMKMLNSSVFSTS